MRARIVLPAGSWDARLEIDKVVADHDQRYRRRILLQTDGGRDILLDLKRACHLRDGDGLLLEDGRVVRIVARPERLLAITAVDAPALLRLAWHLGNRHLPTMLLPDRLLIREDHVIADMVRGLGARVAPVEAPFDPETGAYEVNTQGASQHHHHHHHSS